MVKLVRGKSRS